MRHRSFAQVDVFTSVPYRGNPVAVVLDADGLTDEAMARFARWTNLSETTFVLPPTDPAADYRLRIFTPRGELPFAGHPTLGSAHAWLESGATPHVTGMLVQQCGIGLVRIRAGYRLAFDAPPLTRSGPADPEVRAQVARSLRLSDDAVLACEWVANGPSWVVARVADAATVLAIEPDLAEMGDLEVGVVGPHRAGGPADIEVRAFVPGLGITEDPVTGSLNAGLARWLVPLGELPPHYVVAQGTAIGREGRIHVDRDGDHLWIGGDTVTCISGEVMI